MKNTTNDIPTASLGHRPAAGLRSTSTLVKLIAIVVLSCSSVVAANAESPLKIAIISSLPMPVTIGMSPSTKKRLAFAGTCLALTMILAWYFVYYRVLYPRHFALFEVRNTAPKGLPIFMFHENDASELEALFSHLSRNNYRTLDLQSFLDIIEGRREYDPKDVVLTFDDGKLALWTITAPLVQKHGFSAIAFVNPGKVESSNGTRPHHQALTHDDLNRYCSWAEIHALTDMGFTIQSHSMHHERHMFHCPSRHEEHKDDILESLSHSRTTITEKGFGDQAIFCAPFGSVSPTLIESAHKAGYRHVLGVKPMEPVKTFCGPENDRADCGYLLRFNFRTIFSLPGHNRKGLIARIWLRLMQGGDRKLPM